MAHQHGQNSHGLKITGFKLPTSGSLSHIRHIDQEKQGSHSSRLKLQIVTRCRHRRRSNDRRVFNIKSLAKSARLRSNAVSFLSFSCPAVKPPKFRGFSLICSGQDCGSAGVEKTVSKGERSFGCALGEALRRSGRGS